MISDHKLPICVFRLNILMHLSVLCWNWVINCWPMAMDFNSSCCPPDRIPRAVVPRVVQILCDRGFPYNVRVFTCFSLQGFD